MEGPWRAPRDVAECKGNSEQSIGERHQMFGSELPHESCKAKGGDAVAVGGLVDAKAKISSTRAQASLPLQMEVKYILTYANAVILVSSMET